MNRTLASVRCVCFMATFSAVRHDRILETHHQQLLACGKPPVALAFCPRKLLIIFNRLLKNPHFQLAG